MLTVGLVLAVLAVFIVWLIILGRIDNARRARQMADGTYARQFVFVEDDGSARELTEEQIEHLNTKFDPFDGNRPYIKSRYRQRTPDGKLRGYLLRRKLPRRVKVKPSR